MVVLIVMNEELKLKYKNLFYNVSNINNRLNTILYRLNELNSYLKDNAMVDNKIIENNNYYIVKNKINNVSNELSYTIIPSLRNKSF